MSNFSVSLPASESPLGSVYFHPKTGFINYYPSVEAPNTLQHAGNNQLNWTNGFLYENLRNPNSNDSKILLELSRLNKSEENLLLKIQSLSQNLSDDFKDLRNQISSLQNIDQNILSQINSIASQAIPSNSNLELKLEILKLNDQIVPKRHKNYYPKFKNNFRRKHRCYC